MNIYNNVLNNLDELKLEKIKSCLCFVPGLMDTQN